MLCVRRRWLIFKFSAVLVLVDFADVKTAPNAKQHFEDLWFSTGKIPTGSVKEYYQEVSHGAITLSGEVLGPFQLSHNMAYYANGLSGKDGPEPNSQTMAAEAVRLATGKTNFDKFDNDGNGYVSSYREFSAQCRSVMSGLTNIADRPLLRRACGHCGRGSAWAAAERLHLEREVEHSTRAAAW
jgi:immune inhibitor A peptidase M6